MPNSRPTITLGSCNVQWRLAMSRTRYHFGDNRQPHFLTCTVVAWLPVFTRPEAVQIVLDSWRFLQNENRITLLGYVVLENHLHFIAAAEHLGKEVGDFKSYTAKKANRVT